MAMLAIFPSGHHVGVGAILDRELLDYNSQVVISSTRRDPGRQREKIISLEGQRGLPIRANEINHLALVVSR
jgi:hypothetical protein